MNKYDKFIERFSKSRGISEEEAKKHVLAKAYEEMIREENKIARKNPDDMS